MLRRYGLACLTVAVLTGLGVSMLSPVRAANEPAAAEWPQWRGPNRDGISDEKGLLQKWGEKGPPLAWETKGLGKGFSSVAIHDGHIVTLGRKNGGLNLTAVSTAGGKELWSTQLLKKTDKDPNCTPTIGGDLVYSVSTDGGLFCNELKTGKLVWEKNFKADFGGRMMSGWGYSESPLVDGDRLICSPGAKDASLAALDPKTGNVIWKSTIPKFGDRGSDGAAYSSVVVSHGAGIKQYVQLMGRGVISVAADDGRFLWGYNAVANGTANIPTPLIHGDYVFASTGYGTGAALLKLSKDGDIGVKADEQYFLKAKDFQNHHGGMIMLGDYIYCGSQHNQGFPICLEWKTGKIVWSHGRGVGDGSAAVAYADGNLYFRYQKGALALIEANPKEYKEKGSFVPPQGGDPCWSHPVIAGKRLYLREQDALYCYELSADQLAAK
jgi:outer membrane protein assembly factor BamB